MEKEKLEIVLEEVLEESKGMRGAIEELKQQVWQLKEKAENFENKLDGMKVVAPPVDTGTGSGHYQDRRCQDPATDHGTAQNGGAPKTLFVVPRTPRNGVLPGHIPTNPVADTGKCILLPFCLG